MANNTISFQNQQLFDPGALAQSLPYIQNGLTYVSNNINIHPRDEAGNIILQENSETNPLLIIEPVIPNIATRSVLRVVDTSFQYFKFPVASSVSTPEISAEDLALDLSAIEFDPVYARYKPSEDREVPVQSVPAGILMDEVVEGLPQNNTNCYTVSKDVKNSGKDLLFRIKLTHTFNSDIDSIGTIFYSLIKTGPQFNLNRKWRGEFSSVRTTVVDFNALIRDIAVTMRDICDDPAKLGGEYNTINYEEPWITYHRWFRDINIPPEQTRLTGNQDDAIDFVKTRDSKKVPRTSQDTYNSLLTELETKLNAYKQAVNSSNDTWGFINNGTTQTVYINERILNSDFEIGDIFQIGAYSGQEGHTILNNQSYWVISDASKNVDLWNQENVE